MDIRLMEYAIEVYYKKSFTKAAEALHIAQPSLSKQITKLETELGVQLFHRGNKSIEATLDGLRFIESAEKIMRMRNDLGREMKDRKEGISGDLVIGTTAITGGHVLPPLLKAFKEKYPGITIHLVEESTETLINLTKSKNVDISILASPFEESSLEKIAMFSEPLFIALPKVSPWISDEMMSMMTSGKITLNQLASYPFILLKKGYGFRETVQNVCKDFGFTPNVAYETSSIETAQTLVANGLGITIVPQMVLRNQKSNQPVYIELSSKYIRTLFFTFSTERYLSMASKALIELFQKQNM